MAFDSIMAVHKLDHTGIRAAGTRRKTFKDCKGPQGYIDMKCRVVNAR